MTELARDVRLAARSLSKTPAFTALSLLTVALGIAASTAVFSMVNGALLKKLPYAADRRLLHSQPIVSVQTLEELRGARLSESRVTTLLLALFAAISLVITTGGLDGVVAYSVGQRTTEIGIRMALGADARNILWAVTRSGARVIAAGLAVGLATALVATRLMGTLLYEVSATDARTYFAVTFVLALIGVLSCLIPARRALRVGPIKALRAG